jgi:hypothetical protein
MSAIKNAPGILYKYIKVEHALGVLQDLKLRITPPNEFDDPFEFLLRVEGDMPRSRVKKMMKAKDYQRELYELAKSKGIVVGSFKDFRKGFRADREKHVGDAIQHAQPVITAYLKQPYKDEISKRYGVLCLTEVPDSILMWSHYASGHRGIVLGMGILPHWKLHRIDYSTERIPADLRWYQNDESYLEMMTKLVKSKSQDWAYEKEWRAVSQLEKAERQLRDGKPCYLVSIETEVIKEIILGLRFPERNLGVVRALCRHRYPRAHLLQATRDENRFGLVMKDVSLDS